MASYTINITESEEIALLTVMADPADWAENFVKVRAQKAATDIISKLIAYCNTNSIAIAVGQDAQILQAKELGLISTEVPVISAASIME